MTKKFPVLPVEDYAVIVGEQASKDCIAYNKDSGICRTGSTPAKGDMEIIASIFKRIEGIPLIELPDEDDFEHPNNKEIYLAGDYSLKRLAEILEKYGYKAAQSKGQYSEEDIQKVLNIAQSACNMPHEEDVLISRNFIEQELKNLHSTKIPTSVTLEMETVIVMGMECIPSSPQLIKENSDKDSADHSWKPVITNPETNTIIPKEVHYDKV